MNKSSDVAVLKKIGAPYLLATGIPCYIDKKGHRHLDELWVKDLLEHLKYIKKMSLAGPVVYGEPPSKHINLTNMKAFDSVNFIDLPGNIGTIGMIAKLPKIISILWRSVKSNKIIHTGIGGWPVPYGWLLTPMAKINNKLLVIIVESAFWRLTPGVVANIQTKLRSAFSEFVGSWCVSKANLAIFTQEEYKKSLLTNGISVGHVDPASWIDEETVVSEEKAVEMWVQKAETVKSGLKVIYVGRLTIQKGIGVLLHSLQILEEGKIRIELDILGEGDQLVECLRVSALEMKYVTVRVLGTVPYNSSFYELLGKYHLLVVPTISDEQPRIIYDAFSQGIPVFASNTAGNRDCIEHLVNGYLFEPNSPVALSDALEWATVNAVDLPAMGLSATKVASSMTHSAMHRRRWALLDSLLSN